ncbi:MAG: ABC transporter ATP-binding protein [Clostridia bacterium]|jgi:iron complex transport system ATP-binding protein|nr:ABC transporter ATP-binding protein [Clostridia bacterium]
MFSVKNLSFAYDNKDVLSSVSLEICSGFVSIIGPNGSGKTTLLKLMTGFLDAKADTIEMNGKALSKISIRERAKIFTVINQLQRFTFPFSCMEMVSLGRYPYKRNINALSALDYEVIIECMKDTEVLQFKDKLITDISGGEQQRVVLACALAQKTQVLFLDEAFSALDISHKARIVRLLKEKVDKEGLTVIAIMHDLNIAYRYSDKVCILDEGKVAAFDEPQKAMTKQTIAKVFDVDIDLVEGKGFFINI